MSEAIAIGERSGVPVDIIHLKIADRSLWGRMPAIVALIDQARRRGVNVQANVYPYTRGNNDLVSIIPPWAHEGGKDRLLERLKDKAVRARLRAEIQSGIPGWYNHYTAVGGLEPDVDQRQAERAQSPVPGPDHGRGHRRPIGWSEPAT